MDDVERVEEIHHPISSESDESDGVPGPYHGDVSLSYSGADGYWVRRKFYDGAA